MNSNIVRKLTSRKFILAVITAITGIVTLCVGDSEIVQVIAGAAMTIIPTVIYCFMEGVIDARSVKTITNATTNAAEKLGADEKCINIIEQIGAVGEVLVDGDGVEK